jgi:hypothetical protein
VKIERVGRIGRIGRMHVLLKAPQRHAVIEVDGAGVWSDQFTRAGIGAGVRDAIARRGERGGPVARQIEIALESMRA